MNGWEERAIQVIALAIAQAQMNGLDAKATIEAIDAAYPFGERKMWPYKIWLKVRRRALLALEVGPGEERIRPCAACGAASFAPCRPIGDEQLTGSHAARTETRR